MARLAGFPVRRGWPEWSDGPARAPALPRVPSCPDCSCGFLLGSQARCGERRDATWFAVVSVLGALAPSPAGDAGWCGTPDQTSSWSRQRLGSAGPTGVHHPADRPDLICPTLAILGRNSSKSEGG